MKRFMILVTLVCFGYAATAFADIDTLSNGGNAIKDNTYSIDTGSGQTVDEITFEVDPQTKSSSLGNCTMNPQDGAGTTTNFVLEEPRPVQAMMRMSTFTNSDDNTSVTPIAYSPFTSSGQTSNDDGYNNGPPIQFISDPDEIIVSPGPDGPGPSAATPEPGTLLILGLGAIGMLPVVRRFRRK